MFQKFVTMIDSNKIIWHIPGEYAKLYQIIPRLHSNKNNEDPHLAWANI